jgi:TolB-like protein/Tfp pilus assembly protein PilF
MTARVYEFDRFRLDAGARVLFRDRTRMQLTPKAVDLLLALIEKRGAPAGREELFLEVWPDVVVEDGTLTSHISLLRKTLGEGFIETIPKRGYRFTGAIEERAPASEDRVLLAVLPFENLGGSRKDDSFADGLTEELITQLGRLNAARLGVIARTSSMAYKSTDKTIERVGRELGVSYVLEGSARRAGGRVRIAAQLIQVSDQTHVWAESYEGSLEDILALQSSVARAVAKQIESRLLPQESSAKQVVPEAYEAYLQGRYLWHRRSGADLDASIRSFQHAIERDPAYASPYAGLADAYLSLLDHNVMQPSEATAKARPLLATALRLDESLAEAHSSLAHAAFHQFDWPAAEREFTRALALNPSCSTALHYGANFLVAMRRQDEGVAMAEEERRLDPISPSAHANLACILWFTGRFERSIAMAEKAIELNPGYGRAYEDLGRAAEQAGQLERAIDAFQKMIALEPFAHGTLASLAYAYALAGRRDQTARILRELEDAAKSRFVSAYAFALVHLALGNTDEAFVWLDKAVGDRSSSMPFLDVNPRMASLRGDPRFEQLRRRVGLHAAQR